jgi:hypothetical protein
MERRAREGGDAAGEHRSWPGAMSLTCKIGLTCSDGRAVECSSATALRTQAKASGLGGWMRYQ